MQKLLDEKTIVFNILKWHVENDFMDSKFWSIQKEWKAILKCLIRNLVNILKQIQAVIVTKRGITKY